MTTLTQTLGHAARLLLAGFFLAVQAASAQTPSEQLADAMQRFEAGRWAETVAVFESLLAGDDLGLEERSEARKYLGRGCVLLRRDDDAVAVFKDLVGSDPEFTMRDLALSFEKEPDDYAVRLFAQAALEWRQEQLARQKARLERTSRRSAASRSLLLPGLGQRYQGYRGRSWAMVGLTGAAVAYAVVADRSYRNARDAYDNGQVGDDFDRLWRDYSDKANTADLALAAVGAVWGLNLLDAALSGPNLGGLESVRVTPAPDAATGVQLALRWEF